MLGNQGQNTFYHYLPLSTVKRGKQGKYPGLVGSLIIETYFSNVSAQDFFRGPLPGLWEMFLGRSRDTTCYKSFVRI